MKLKEYLESLNGNTIVSIGAKNGSAYMYIGKAENVELISKVFDDYIEEKKQELSESKVRLNTLAFSVPEKAGDEVLDEYYVKEYAKAVTQTYRAIKRIKEYLKNYVDPLEREVMETSKRIDEKGYRVIVPGVEYADFWLKSEFDVKHV